MPAEGILDLIEGRVAFIFAEDNFDVDRIVGPENISERDMDRLVRVLMRDFDGSFASQVSPGDILVGGSNFGFGHPHYPPMQGMRHLGIAAVVAESFAPGYWREEMEEGFPQISCPGILRSVRRWDEISISIRLGTLVNRSNDARLAIEPFTAGEQALIEAGGLHALLRSEQMTGA